MNTICLHDKNRIEVFLRRNTFLNIYQLGDLEEGDETKAIALVYSRLSRPTLLVMGNASQLPVVRELLASIMPLLPKRFYSHLGVGLSDVLAGDYRMDSYGEHYKMALTDVAKFGRVDTSGVEALTGSDADEALGLYDASYPGHWSEASVLDTKQYFGLRDKNRLVSIAGVHVYSEKYRVAALGNITTHPAHRRSGYAAAVTARLCKNLIKTVEDVSVNVKADNQAAIGCYRKLGFEIVGVYEEFSAEAARQQ
jgi:ribosomal protein S18 acetylase RimI-like enzyme